MNELEVVKTTLKDAVPIINRLPKYSGWTQGIMTRLCDAGQECDYYVCVSKVNQADRGKWLYDMTWLWRERDLLIDVGLVLECEWGYFPAVRVDFVKLLLAKAKLRCMIFWAANRQDAIDYVLHLVEVIGEFQRTELKDNYLFCVWLENEARFYFNVYPNG